MERFGESKYSEDWTPQMFDSIGMRQIKKLNTAFYFRYTEGIEAVDIWSDDLISYHGKMFCFTYTSGNDEHKYYGMSFDMTDSVAKKIANKFFELHIEQIPVQDSLTNVRCEDIVDGFGISYEYKNRDKYNQKTYCYFEGKDSIREFQVIVSFNNFICAETGVDDKFKVFMDYLPSGTYWYRGAIQFSVPYGYRKGGL